MWTKYTKYIKDLCNIKIKDAKNKTSLKCSIDYLESFFIETLSFNPKRIMILIDFIRNDYGYKSVMDNYIESIQVINSGYPISNIKKLALKINQVN